MVNDTQLEPTLEDLAIEAAMFLETLPTYVSDNTLCRAGQMAFALRTCVQNRCDAPAATPSPETAVGGEVQKINEDGELTSTCKHCGEPISQTKSTGSWYHDSGWSRMCTKLNAAPVPAAVDDEGDSMNTITFGDSKNVANPDVACPKCGGTKPTCCRCPDQPAPTAKRFIDEFTQATIEAHVGFHHEKPYHECDYDVCVRRREMIDHAAALRSGEGK